MSRYEYLTKKQANIIYAAIKRGDLTASKKWINRMYNTVQNTCDDSLIMMHDCQNIVSLIFESNFEIAQAIIDGAHAEYRHVKVGTVTITVTKENEDDYLFYEIGDIVEEDIWEMQWVLY